ncbi:MAG TPA: hypothetical protein ENK09_12750 [Nitrospirae bacterium]|nr:hypothetical protein [Nitrospirota bacterium]
MGLLRDIIGRLGFRKRYTPVGKDYLALRAELYRYKNRLSALEDVLNHKVTELEKRLEKLEEANSKTDQIIKIVESLEPDSRRN